GYKKTRQEITINPSETASVNNVMIKATSELDEVVVMGKSEVVRIMKKGFSEEAIEIKPLKTQSPDHFKK
ncbi:MAG: hypothetical protein AAF361_13920, partial [Bacteroidota bacterium]